VFRKEWGFDSLHGHQHITSETNGRISDLRAKVEKKNMAIESRREKDAIGFRYGRFKELGSVYTQDEILAVVKESVPDFDRAQDVSIR
jgi:hypothetical protein